LRRFNVAVAFKQQGFSLVEVLVAIMVTMIFVSVTMQMFVSAAFFRARADQYNQAMNWIQEDFENTFNLASQYEINVEPYSAKCTAATPADGLAASFLADAVNGLGGANVILGPRAFGGKSFVLKRTGNYANSVDPYKLLSLDYAVTVEGGTEEVARIKTEVAVYSAFKCPE
jgi:prepilin-type N-terminal cleavage/methylation domain-containing protein